jgi:hypothetical protein
VDGTPAAGGISISHPSDSFEQAAEHTAAQVMTGGPAAAMPASAGAGVTAQRETADQDDEEQIQTLVAQREGEGQEDKLEDDSDQG